LESDLGELIRRVNEGAPNAREALFAAAYGELRRLARSRLYRDGRSTMLQTTALVHESYLRFVRSGLLHSDDRRAFFAYMSQTMRSVIVETARAGLAYKRGGDLEQVTLDTLIAEHLPAGESEILKVHEALDALRHDEPDLAQVVEMRYFGGCDEEQIADAMGVTTRTVRRHWVKARALLRALLES
jgi:RNA polymerase sigma factor (TIGR02999 family)